MRNSRSEVYEQVVVESAEAEGNYEGEGDDDGEGEFENDEIYRYMKTTKLSPRSQAHLEKFDLSQEEKMIKSYICNLQLSRKLHGRIYITNQKVCFYSIYNEESEMFGKATTVSIPYSEMDYLKKQRTACIFGDVLEIFTKDGNMTRLTGLRKRNKVYKLVTKLMQNLPLTEVAEDESANSNYEIMHQLQTKRTIVNVKIDQEEPMLQKKNTRFDNQFIEQLSQLEEFEEPDLAELDEEFEEEIMNQYIPIHEDIYKHIDIKTFYNRVYGDFIYSNGATFLQNFLDKDDNTDIEIGERSEPVPDLLTMKSYRESSFVVSYTHPINQVMCPPTCHVEETHTSFFLSPKKIVILKKVESSGFPYSDSFMPIYMITLEQQFNPSKKTYSVKQNTDIRVKFLKTVRFFKGKIKSRAEHEMDVLVNDVKIPFIEACLTKHDKNKA